MKVSSFDDYDLLFLASSRLCTPLTLRYQICPLANECNKQMSGKMFALKEMVWGEGGRGIVRRMNLN